MTTTTLPTPAVTPALGNRVLAVLRLHFVNPMGILILPWGILLTILLANVAIWALIMANLDPTADRTKVTEGFQYSGASLFIFNYMVVVAVQAINQSFPFAQGLSVTRRHYYLGTALTFVLLGLIFSVGMTILAVIEEATGGWGLGGRMFTALYFGDGAWHEKLFIFFALMEFFLFVGAAVAGIWVRWKGVGLTAFFVGLTFLLIGVGALIGLTSGWVAVGTWFATTGWTGSYAWSLVLTAIAAVSGFFLLRRATPKS